MSFYTIKLASNHKERQTILIGITDKPWEFMEKWLKDRDQFKITFRDHDKLIITTVWNREVDEEKYLDYRVNKDYTLYTHWLKCNKIKEGNMYQIYIPLEGDSGYYI